MKAHRLIALLATALAAAVVRADGPSDNAPDKVRPVPPPGVEIPAADRTELEAGVADLGKEIDDLRTALKDNPTLLDLLPDVQIYYYAVRYPLTYNEFYGDAAKQVAVAKALLQQGHERAQALRDGKAPWTTAAGRIARGYVSRIDGSVQPYGLFVPDSYKADSPDKHRLDLWCHGRGENLTELNFIDGCQKANPTFTPPDAFVLQLYGRYCCANRFAGEIDAFEAMNSVKKRYPIDENRVAIRGFSMGGAACWDLAVHHPSVWAAAAPGAGFSETVDFLKVFQNEPVKPTWYEQKLYHMYDATDYAGNLFNCPTVAYSGELDTQKQAADMMVAAANREGLKFAYLIGPGVKHQYEPETKKELAKEIDAIVQKGRDEVPAEVRFTTYTLRYNRDAWVTVDGLEKHWERADVKAKVADNHLVVETKNVSAFTMSLPAGKGNFAQGDFPRIKIDGADVEVPQADANGKWTVHLRKADGKWSSVAKTDDGTLAKRHGLQGPIDDAFMGSFLMVKPTGKPLNDKVGAWAATEMKHAVDHWRKQFRGEAPVKDDGEITDADIAAHNLVLWGDPSSNKILAKIADKLPIRWDADKIAVDADSFPSANNVAVLIYPNPLNPKRYVVLNSGFTFREYDYLNNARQTSKLPDYAVIDVSTPPSSRLPGAVATAGFFDEHWKLQPEGGK
ncbi:MAG TPA: prolyl oligopeptidase family serine peptidase [Gemmataceae bacterium]|nr:prolyl oligopeptidase family serine peptidase [Gemmataceae bacterium]